MGSAISAEQIFTLKLLPFGFFSAERGCTYNPDMVYFYKMLNTLFIQKWTITIIIFNCACFYSVCTYSVFILVLKAQADALMSFKKRNMLKNQKVFEIIQLACHTKLYSYPEKLVNRKNRADVNIVKVESNCLGK